MEEKMNYEGFEDCLLVRFDSTKLGGVRYVFRFKNGYGASVVKNKYSYGGSEGLWELAVLLFTDENDKYDLTYDTSITEDVLGYLTGEDVKETLQKIKELKTVPFHFA